MRVWPVSVVLTIWYREHSDPPSVMDLISPCGQRVWGQKQPAYSSLPCQRSPVFRYLIAYRLRGRIWRDPALPFSNSTGGNHPSLFVRAMSLGLCLLLSRGVNSHPPGATSAWANSFLCFPSLSGLIHFFPSVLATKSQALAKEHQPKFWTFT